MDFIDLKTQLHDCRAELDRRIANVLDRGQFILGPEVGELETTLAAFVGVEHCVSVSSGTDALLIALMALGIGPGDEVITTPFSFIATTEVIVLLGATPRFVDIDPSTGNLNIDQIESKLTSRTRAILPVSLYGNIPDMNAINEIASRHGNIPVIEDAAQSFGATFQGRRSCGVSTIGCTSFFPSKPLGCYGDGGALFTNDAAIAAASREIRVHGQSRRYVHTRVGVGGRMDTLQCAILLAKWPRFESEVERRSEVAKAYHQKLVERIPAATTLSRSEANSDFHGIRLMETTDDSTSVFAQYTILVSDRDAVQESMSSRGIPTAVHYPFSITSQPAYSQFAERDATPTSDWLAKHVLSLPMGPDLNGDDQDLVVDGLARHFQANAMRRAG